jgi:hypothetical protein
VHDYVLAVEAASPPDTRVDFDMRPVQASGTYLLDREGGAILQVAAAGDTFHINTVGRRIWELCDGMHTLRNIVEVILAEFEVDEPTARRDVEGFVHQLCEFQLVVLERGGRAG